MTTVLTMECVSTLTDLIRRSGRYPVLVNEGIVAMTLLCTHQAGGKENKVSFPTMITIVISIHVGALVLEALTTALNGKSAIDGASTVSTTVNSTDSLPTPSPRNDDLAGPEHALDMLVNVLRNVDNPVNFPIELRVNTCTFFLQLQRHASGDSLAPIREIILPVLQQIAEDSQEVEEEEKLVKVVNQLITSWTISP